MPLSPDAGSHSHSGASKLGSGFPAAEGWPKAAVSWSVVSMEQGSDVPSVPALLAAALAVVAAAVVGAAAFGVTGDVVEAAEQPATSAPTAMASIVCRRTALAIATGFPFCVRPSGSP